MNIDKTLEEILNNHYQKSSDNLILSVKTALSAMKEAYELGRGERESMLLTAFNQYRSSGFIEGRDKALQWWADKINVPGNKGIETTTKEAILSGKTAKELQP
jgi:hypothetical protein